MTTATRGKAAQQTTTPKAKPALNTETIEIDLGVKGKRLLDKMAEFRQQRLAAEREEKILKEQLTKLIDDTLGREQKPSEKLLVRASKVIRGTRSWRRRKNTDLDLLLEGWPEAFEAVVSTKEFTQFDVA